MEKLPLSYVVLLGLVFIGRMSSYSHAKTYTVGDNSGWDISSDLDLWTVDKKFQVGDVLQFQYSKTHSVSEVSKKNFDSCGTTDTIKTYNNDGNTTVELAKPGQMYFVCGNTLHCLGGMKLQVHVDGTQAYAPAAGAPQATSGESDLPGGSNRPTSDGKRLSRGWGLSVVRIMILVASVLLLVRF